MESLKKALIFIPARYESKRFPGKLLAELHGRPVIEWVYRGAKESRLASGVYVVTDSERIRDAVTGFGGEVIFRKRSFDCGTDRIADVVNHFDAEIIINLQGDEPLVKGDVLDSLITVMRKEFPPMATLAKPLESPEEFTDSNVVKVVCDRRGYALYFSRAPIPFHATDSTALKHIGIYAFTRDSIMEFTSLPRGKLEEVERLEQLRALEAGWRIRVVLTDRKFVSIDIPEDIKKAERLLVGR